MSRDRRLGIRRLHRREEGEEPELGPRLPAPTVSAPWSQETQALLARGEVVGCEPIPLGSNYSFTVALAGGDGRRCLAVYKPRRGEVPLWDFPDGTLYRREHAAYLLSQALRWPFIPPCVIRDGPYGVGSMQLYVQPAERSSLFRFRGQHQAELCRITLFDHLANNADRKASHIIRDRAGQVWGIDHGLTFHEEWKLRTVIFDFSEQPIPADLLRSLRELRDDRARLAPLQAQLCELLSVREVEVLLARLEALLARGVFPSLDPYVNVPRGFF